MIVVAPQIPEQILLEWLRHLSWESENVCLICGSRPGWGICCESRTGVGRRDRGFLIYRDGVSEIAHAVIRQRHRALSSRASQQASSSKGLARGVGVLGINEGMGGVAYARPPISILQGVARCGGEQEQIPFSGRTLGASDFF